MAKSSFRELSASPSPISTVCLACEQPPLLDAPIPLCTEHVRLTFAFYLLRAQDELSANDLQPDPVEEVLDRSSSSVLDKPGFVYFVRFADRIKIGWSGNPTRRFRNIPHDEVMAVIPGTMDDEHSYHNRFAALRVHGEWFRADRTLVDFIAALAA